MHNLVVVCVGGERIQMGSCCIQNPSFLHWRRCFSPFCSRKHAYSGVIGGTDGAPKTRKIVRILDPLL